MSQFDEWDDLDILQQRCLLNYVPLPSPRAHDDEFNDLLARLHEMEDINLQLLQHGAEMQLQLQQLTSQVSEQQHVIHELEAEVSDQQYVIDELHRQVAQGSKKNHQATKKRLDKRHCTPTNHARS